MNFGLFKKFNHRRFNYLPRYYDEDKEKLDAIVGKYDKSKDQTELSKRRIASGFSSKKSNTGYARKSKFQSSLRLVLIIAFLVYFSYLILKSDKFILFLESLD